MSLNIKKKLPYCPRGSRRNKKTGECQQYNKDGKKKYCPKGTRKNRKSGECEQYEKLRKIKENVGFKVESEEKKRSSPSTSLKKTRRTVLRSSPKRTVLRSSPKSKPLSLTDIDIDMNADAAADADAAVKTIPLAKTKQKTRRNKKTSVLDDGEYVPFKRNPIPTKISEFLSV